MKWRAQTTIGSLLHVRCYSCGNDLRRAKAVAASSEDVVAVEWVSQALENGWIRLGDSVVYSPAFFAGLAVLIQGLNSRQGRQGFDMEPLVRRRQLLREACALLHAWPSEFLRFATARKWTVTSLLVSHKTLPFWLHRVVKSNLDKRHAAISQAEATSILEQTARSGFPGSFARARQISGRMVERHHLISVVDTSIDDEVFALLLAQIDHRIAQTLDKRERAHLFADKLIFALARIHGFTQVQIVTLSIADAEILASDKAPNFWMTPITKRDVGPWVGWYLRSVRPQLRPAKRVTNLFVSRFGGKPLSANAIGARFSGYCRDAFLQRKIKDYRSLAVRDDLAS